MRSSRPGSNGCGLADAPPRIVGPWRDLRSIPTRRSLLPPPVAGRTDPRWQASWRHLFEVYGPAMERYVAAILRRTAGPAADPQDAPDVVAAYLVACLEKGWLEREAGEIRCFRAWLKVQLARFTRTWVRDRSAARRWAPTLPGDGALADAAAPEPDLDAALDAAMVDAAVARALAHLREGNATYGEIVADLLRTDGAGSADLGPRLGWPAKDLAVLRHRARRRFAALLADELRATVRDASAFDALLAALDRHLP